MDTKNKRYYVYVLRSLRNGKRYVGYTGIAAHERLKQHNQGTNQWTKQNGPFELVYSEEYTMKSDAQKREKFLKSGVGRKYLDEYIKKETHSSVSAKGGSASGGG